jgi:hypothetical protein
VTMKRVDLFMIEFDYCSSGGVTPKAGTMPSRGS